VILIYIQRAHRDGLNISLENVMDTWIEQMNYPVVNVTFDVNSGKINLHQKRFLFTCASNQTKCEESRYETWWLCWHFNLFSFKI